MRYTITPTPRFRALCPDFVGAAITATVQNSPSSPALWQEIEAFAQQLRQQFTPDSLKLRPGIAATRNAYKAAGKDPSRYRPACEQLARRVLQGKPLYRVDTLVDAVNLASLSSGYSTAALDADKLPHPGIELDFGHAGEPYEGIGRGPLNIENLPVYRDRTGPFATPTSDSTRTMLSPDTCRLLVLINGYDGNNQQLDETVRLTERLLTQYAQASEVEHTTF